MTALDKLIIKNANDLHRTGKLSLELGSQLNNYAPDDAAPAVAHFFYGNKL